MLKHALLGLLARQPRYGYELKNALEQALGGNWEINFGQIYQGRVLHQAGRASPGRVRWRVSDDLRPATGLLATTARDENVGHRGWR
jgi:DNA-binding PadR family transcriptional regulator